MPVQFTDFSRAPLLDSPWENMLEDVLKGYKMSQEPAKMADEQKQRQLANKLKEVEVAHKPKEYELGDKEKTLANSLKAKALEYYDADRDLNRQLKQAQINKFLQSPVNAIRLSGAIANFKATHPEATDEEVRKFTDDYYGAQIDRTRALTERTKDITSGSSFDKMPMNDRKQVVALFKGMGVDPIKAVSLARQGIQPSEYAKQQGIDINTVNPDYALSDQLVKEAQRASAYQDELESLEKNITSGMAEYPNKLQGYSLDQVFDMLKGDSPQKVGKALAAAALQPELSALRLKVQGGNVGIEAIRELTDKSLGKLKTLESLVDKPTYLAMQGYIQDWLKQASDTRINSLKKFSQIKSDRGNALTSTSPSEGGGQRQSEAPEMPTFKTKKDFQEWFKKLSPEKQQAVRANMKRGK